LQQDKKWDKCNKKDMKRKKEADYSIIHADVLISEMHLGIVPIFFEIKGWIYICWFTGVTSDTGMIQKSLGFSLLTIFIHLSKINNKNK